MRFRIDPRDAARAPPPAPPATPPATPPAAAARPPTAAAPPAAPAAAAPAAMPLAARIEAALGALRERRALGMAIAIALLLGGGVTVGAMYALDMGPFAYPNKYLLADDEIPRGLSNAPVTRDAREELGLRENPGEIPPEKLSEMTGGGPRPSAVWVQGLADGVGEPDVIIFAAEYANEEDANAGAGRLRLGCSFQQGASMTVLRDGDVVVLVFAESDGRSWISPVVAALKAKNSDLQTVCSR